ncbi:MAG: SGNH/GDSL hydrolase family protein [Candidatus Aminicenantes bacterium]|nr:SGNH/GDSL hydrolase family protein [Candidatus Aminicenantes bacterium]
MKRRFMRFFHILLFFMALVQYAPQAMAFHPSRAMEDTWNEGRLHTPEGEFTYQISSNGVRVKDCRDRIVFQARHDSRDSLALACSHSTSHGFHAFFQHLDPVTGIRHLEMVSSIQPPVITIASSEDIFSPVLVTDPGDIVVAVMDGFRLSAWDLASGRRIWQKSFQTPVINPRRVFFNQREAIRFQLFHAGRYRNFHFFTGPGFPPARIYGPDPDETYPDPRFPNPEQPDPNTILAFGDSITYGYVNKTPAPDLGYVPRLTDLLYPEYMDIVLINAGNPGETTLRAMDRYDSVLSSSNAAYLLFHQGINDTLWPGTIPVSTTLFNIRTIMQRAQELDMQPILSTIIPRDPSHWSGTGIYRTRAEAIREGILLIAADMSLPLIDFWKLFTRYPLKDGGYKVLMSDYVHPSEKGYQLMADQWYQTLLDIPPGAPDQVSVIESAPWRITIRWQPRSEFDMGDYVVMYGTSAQNLDTRVIVNQPETTLLRAPFQAELQRTRWLQVFARDRYGNTGPGSAVTRIDFPLSAASAEKETDQKQMPTVKRIPLKRDDNTDASR